MFLIAAMCIGFQRVPPEDLMRSLVDHYRKLKSLSAQVVHHRDFLANVKDATDRLQWLAPKRFELTCDKDSVPKLDFDGRHLVTTIPQVPPLMEDLNLDTTEISAWEYRGGILLSLLMRSPLADQYLKPLRPAKVTFAYGPALKWHDLPVSEIQGTITRGKSSMLISYYLTPDYHALIGMEMVTGEESIWTQYKDVVENLTLPKDLGSMKH